MASNLSALDALSDKESLEAVLDRVRRKNGTEIVPGLRMVPLKRSSGGEAWGAKRLQRDTSELAIYLLGNDTWFYANGRGAQCGRLLGVYNEVVETLGLQNVKYTTFYKWFMHYIQNGETQYETNLRERRWRMHERTKFSKRDTKVLEKLLEEKPFLYLDEIRIEMKRLVNKLWSPATLWRQMHKLGYTLQAAVFKAKQRSEQLRDQYMERLEQSLIRPEMAIYVDETHKSANASRRVRLWAKRGKPKQIDAWFEEEYRKRYTLIGACDINGFVVPACKVVERERDKNDRNPERGTVDATKFERYVEECLVPVLGRWDLQEPRSLVIMDNASVHCSDKVQEMIERAGARLLYSAPYSPDLNPIEFMFSIYKAGLKRRFANGHHWLANHEWSMEDVTPENAFNYFVKARVPGCQKRQETKTKLKLMALTVQALLVCEDE